MEGLNGVPTTPSGLALLSLNIQQATIKSDFCHISRLLLTYKPDFMFLQEVGRNGNELEAVIDPLGYSISISLHPESKIPLGVACIWRQDFEVSVRVLDPGRIQLLEWSQYRFLNIYGPASNSRDFGTTVGSLRRNFFGMTLQSFLQSGPLPILIGDWNCVLSPMDVEENFAGKNCKPLSELLNILEYKDGFRVLHPMTREYTWSKAECSSSRLDRVYIPSTSFIQLDEVLHHITLSDHKLLFVRVLLPPGRSVPSRNARHGGGVLETQYLPPQRRRVPFSF